jgi:peptide-methionine (S)-S-oxide reductase
MTNLEQATLGGGCFWCLEAIYQRITGVKTVVSGYAGGFVEKPTYKEVCAETTGHAEVIQLEFETTEITFSEILDIFWKCHDPTTLNRQGNDVGTQYRSIICAANQAQIKIANDSKAKAATTFDSPIVTEIIQLKKFYIAEDYHQNYYNLNSSQPYCAFIITPKLTKMNFS